jgi:hypothetical protein
VYKQTLVLPLDNLHLQEEDGDKVFLYLQAIINSSNDRNTQVQGHTKNTAGVY